MTLKLLPLLPFLFFTALFFFCNTKISRGEYGGFEYTLTKCLPILALGLAAFVSFRPPVTPVRTGLPFLDKIVNVRHPAASAFFLSAIGDWYLANRSKSTNDFALGIIPFAAAHYLNTMFCSSNLTIGQHYCWLFLPYLILHGAVIGSLTMLSIILQTPLLFQAVSTPYAFVLGWSVWCAVSNWYFDPNRNRNPITFLYMLGYIVFLFSDSLLIFDQFGSPIPRAQLYILITYYASQALIFESYVLLDEKMKGH